MPILGTLSAFRDWRILPESWRKANLSLPIFVPGPPSSVAVFRQDQASYRGDPK
jgi:hypothetical protein